MRNTGFTGSYVDFDVLFPDIGTTKFAYDPVMVGNGVEFGWRGERPYNVDLTNTSITVTFVTGFSLGGGAFNGFVVSDENGTIPDIKSVSLDTDIPGLDATDVSFDANNIYLNYQGVDVFGTSRLVLNVTFDVPNQSPLGRADVATTDEDTAVWVPVLSNDSDPDGDTLSVLNPSIDAGLGVVSVGADGRLHYDPRGEYDYLGAGANRSVLISFVVSDPYEGQIPGELIVTVQGVNDGPVAVDDTASTDQNTPVTVNVLTTDTDVEGDALTVVTAAITAGLGSVTVRSDGAITYDSTGAYDALDTGESATVEIAYTISDGNGGTDEGVLTVTVEGLSGSMVSGTRNADLIDGAFRNGQGTTNGDDTVFAGSGSDRVLGLDDADALWGEEGNDSLFGGRGNDLLHGENGRDLLDGGLGDDVLDGGRGDDVLTGGGGADEFRFGRSGGADVITDLNADEDAIVLAAGVTLRGVTQLDTDGLGGADSTLLTLSSGSVLLRGGLFKQADLEIL